MIENDQNNQVQHVSELRRCESVWGSECIDPHVHDLGTSLEWSASRPNRFIHRERAPGTHWIGGWVGLITCLDDVEKRKLLPLPGRELPTPLSSSPELVMFIVTQHRQKYLGLA
jgi:hypothetical protein